jgi:hypothetical protein
VPTAPTTQLFPEVVDASTLGQKLMPALYLPIAVEGQADAAGDAVVATMYSILRTDQAIQKFGPTTNRMTALINSLLTRGSGPVIAAASAKGATPTLVQRQAVWALMESDPTVRIRLTDSISQADLVAMATSLANANLINNKQVGFMGMASATAKAALITAAGAVAASGKEGATRSVFVGPGVYDEFGTLRDGGFAAAYVASEVAKNGDPSNDLDLFVLPYLTAIEKDSAAMPVFREKVVSGVAVNDFEDLLQGGVSPLMTPPTPGGVSISHLRTTYTLDSTHDALMTRIIEDQIFLDVKQYVLTAGFLQQGNTPETRKRIKSGVDAVLHERIAWLSPLTQPDGSLGYGVDVTSSPDQRQVTVNYQGQIVRGIQTVQITGNLSITV